MNPTDDDLLAQDAQAREQALALDSFIVEAPAGAGKTELLTQRYLRLLALVDEPEEIIAITFTNKAAGEMRERIQAALDRARRGEVPAEAHRQTTYALAQAALARADACGWQIDQQPGRLRLITIDALCASLARQMPLLSRFGAQPAIADDPRRHYDEAARRVLAGLESSEAGTDAFAAQALGTVLTHLDNDTGRFLRLLADMLARREQWSALWRAGMDHPESAVAEAMQAMVGMELSRSAEAFDATWQAGFMPLARYAADKLGGTPLSDWVAALPVSPEALSAWRALADLLLTNEDQRRKQVTVKNGFPAQDKARKTAMMAVIESLSEAQVAALVRVRRLPDAHADSDDAQVVRALVAVLKQAAAQLWLVFREAGEVDFSELSMRAIAALGDGGGGDADTVAPSELALHLDYAVRHLLVDEFQDTSPAQIDLLAGLTAGWQPGDGRTLFVVGDPMQSIYRFRKADVGLFLQAGARGIGTVALTPLRLSRNNRSDPAVVGWINAAFPQVFPLTDAPLSGEIRYRPFVATRAAQPDIDAGVCVHPLIVTTDDETEQLRRLEAERIIDIVRAERAVDAQRRIAVLVRARDHLQALVAALRRHPEGWRFTAVDVEPLVGRQAVQDLLALTHALHHRADRLHWLALLRAPWCGLTLADLHALCADDHEATIWSLMQDAGRLAYLSDDGRQRLLHVRDVLAEALHGQGRQRRRRWVEDVWRKLGGPICAGGPGSGELADAQAFFARLDALDAAGRFHPDTLDDDMAALFAEADAQADGSLQLMTIHKSKGLEFDTVILPGLQRTLPDNDTPLLIWDSFTLPSGEQIVAAPVNRRRGKGTAPTGYDFLRTLERERSRNEEARVLYVAATRTIRRLHLLGTAVRGDDGALKPPRGLSALTRLWPIVQTDFVQAVGQPAQLEQDTTGVAPPQALADFTPRLVRLAALPSLTAWPAPVLSEPSMTPHEDDATVDAFAAALGTLVHACLEQIIARREDWDAARLRALEPNLVRWLSTRGWPAGQSADGAQRALAMLDTTLASADGGWVLAAHEDDAAELVLASVVKVSAGETAKIRVVDRCFVVDDVRWIVDYKTALVGAAHGATPTESALRAHACRYREQLQGYAGLFAGEGRAVRCAILYVAYGKLIVLD